MNRMHQRILSGMIAAFVFCMAFAVPALRAQNSAKSQPTLPWGSAYFMVDPFWPKPLPNDWLTGSVGGICVDKNDNVITVQRTADANNLNDHEKELAVPSPPFIVYDSAGNVIKTWGDYAVVPNGIHDCYVDYEGNIWVGGNTDAIAQKYSPDGKLLLQIGEKLKFDTDTGKLAGKPLNASHTLLNRPSSFAIDPANGDVYITDGYGNRRVVVFDKTGKYIRQWGRQATKEENEKGVGGVFEEVVHSIVMSKDGLLYVSDREGQRIQVFDKQGNFQKAIVLPRRRADLPGKAEVYWVLLSRDADQKYMFVLAGNDEAMHIVERKSGKIIESFGQSGHMAGQFSYLHSGAINSKNELFLAETITGRRVQKFKPTKPLP